VDENRLTWTVGGLLALAFAWTVSDSAGRDGARTRPGDLPEETPAPWPSEEVDVRAADRDGCHVDGLDFWTGEVRGDYRLSATAGATGDNDRAVRPIELSIASFDDESDTPEAAEWRHFNERCATASLKTLTAAEADFRGCNGDADCVGGFWTADVRGLYAPKADSEPTGEQDPEIPDWAARTKCPGDHVRTPGCPWMLDAS